MNTTKIDLIQEKAEHIWVSRELEKRISPNDSVGIIGGNSLVSFKTVNDSEIEITFSFQKTAFEVAMALSQRITSIGAKPTITLIIDQSQDIRNFLGFEQKTNNKGPMFSDKKRTKPMYKRVPGKRNGGYSLNHLRPELLAIFKPLLESYGLKTEDVRMLFEIQCRTKIVNIYNNEKGRDGISYPILQAMVKEGNCRTGACDVTTDTPKLVASCKGITSNCLFKSVQYASESDASLAKLCIGIWGFDSDRCNHAIIEGGSKIAQHIFLKESGTQIMNSYLSDAGDDIDHVVKVKKELDGII